MRSVEAGALRSSSTALAVRVEISRSFYVRGFDRLSPRYRQAQPAVTGSADAQAVGFRSLMKFVMRIVEQRRPRSSVTTIS
jgi:hypothetical protein